MKRLERLRHAEAAQDAARKEGELSRADLEEQKRMEQEEKANPALKRAREKVSWKFVAGLSLLLQSTLRYYFVITAGYGKIGGN